MSASSRGRQAALSFTRQSRQICPQCVHRLSPSPSAQLVHRAAIRQYSSASAAAASTPETPAPPSPTETIIYPNATAEAPKAMYSIKSGVILSRPPLLTREHTPFEAAFFLYQKRLAERLAGRFPKKFYFKTDTPAVMDWEIKFRERKHTMEKDIGVYDPDGVDSWDDEVLLGLPDTEAGTSATDTSKSSSAAVDAAIPAAETTSDTSGDISRLKDGSPATPTAETTGTTPEAQALEQGKGDITFQKTTSSLYNIKDLPRRIANKGTGEHDHLLVDQDRLRQLLVRGAEMRVSEDGEQLKYAEQTRIELPQPRETAADKTNNTTRLDRKLDRTLYLVVKGENGVWGFPTSDVRTDEAVHETAARALEQAAGVNMNIWHVGRAPITHTLTQPVFKDDGKTVEKKGNKVFYLKSRIMAGQADLRKNSLGLTEFKWLTKEEVAEVLRPEVFDRIRQALPAR